MELLFSISIAKYCKSQYLGLAAFLVIIALGNASSN